MTVTPGLLDRRITLYARQDDGADGFVRPVYVATGTYWGRIDDTTDQFTVPGAPMAHIENRTSAAATVSDAVPVPRFGLLRDGAGPIYYVRGVVPLRALRCQRLELQAVTPNDSATFTLYDAAEVQDGTHLVIGAAE